MAEEIVKVKVDLDVSDFSKNAKAMSDALSKVLGKEVEIFNGRINKTAKLVNDTEQALNSVAGAANKTGDSLKKTNQQWTNLALVIQDLPYGFRGIQNNLPALIGGFASLTGPIYLLSSAVIAFFTAWDAGIIKFGKSTKSADDYAKSFAETLSQETVKLQSLYRVATDSNKSMSDRISAARELKKEYPGLLEKYSDEDIALGKAKSSYIELTKVIKMYATAKAAEGKLIDINAKLLDTQYQIDKKIQEIGPFTGRRYTGYGDEQTSAFLLYKAKVYNGTKDLLNQQKDLNTERSYYEKIIDDNIASFVKLRDIQDNPKPTAKLEDNSIALLKSQQQYYKDNILMFASYEQEIIRRQANLDAKQAELDKKGAKYIANIYKKRDQDIENSRKEAGDKLFAIQAKLGEEEGKELQKQLDERAKIAKEAKQIDDTNLQNSLDALKIESDVRTKILDKTNKSDTEGRIKILEDYKNKLYDLASLGGWTSDQLDKISDAIVRVDAAIEGSKPVLKTFESNWTDTTNQIFETVNKLVEDVIYQLGENLGKALAGEHVDVLGGFGELIGGALEDVGKALIAYGVAIKAFKLAQTNPYAAIAAGFALVVAGAALKSSFSKAQAATGGGGGNFGNVNSNATPGAYMTKPGFGLLGQSPNSTTGNNISGLSAIQDNSSNSGTFVLKGQDLLLSINRAQKASNLKGQNINLAG